MSEDFKQKVVDLESAVSRFAEVVAKPMDEIVRDAAIKRFEFTFELAWKVIKAMNEDKGLSAANPKDNIRLAADNGLIDDVSLWFSFLEARNLAAHVYRQELAEKVYALAKDKFLSEVEKILAKAKAEK